MKKKSKSKPRKTNSVLQNIERYLDRHGRVSLFLSHGAFHIAVAFVLVVAIITMLSQTAHINESKLREISVTISEYSQDASGKRLADMKRLKVKACLDGIEKYGYTQPFIGVLPNTVNRDRTNMAVVNDPVTDGNNVSPLDTMLFNTFTEVEVAVPELKEAVLSNYEKGTSYVHHVDYNGKISVYSVDTRPETQDNTARFRTYYTNLIDHVYNLRENEYIVKSDHLYKATSARNPYINLYLKINGNLMKDNADTLPDNPKSEIQLEFSKEHRYGQEVKSPYAIASIYPKPNQITPDIIGYVGNERVREVLENGGVYVQLYDIKAKAKAERMLLWGSILIGLLFGMLLDVLVELFHKWKKLAQI